VTGLGNPNPGAGPVGHRRKFNKRTLGVEFNIGIRRVVKQRGMVESPKRDNIRCLECLVGL
jgi:hypothetical protein